MAALSARRSCSCREFRSLTALGLDQQSVPGALVDTGIEGGPRGRERAVHPPEEPRRSVSMTGTCSLHISVIDVFPLKLCGFLL